MTLPDKVLSLRKARGISQEELANELQVSRQAVGKWESGQSLPDLDKAVALSDFFGVTVDYLLKETPTSETGVAQVIVKTEAKAQSRTFAVGLIFVILGVLDMIAVFVSAAVNVPSTNAWDASYPSKLWFLIFAGNSQFSDGADGLVLGPVFIVGAALVIVGVILLAKEFFQRRK